jgi:hypothetical protein
MRFPVIVVADDMAPERMAGHGVFDRAKGQAIAPARCGEVGANAQAHAQRLTPPLLPAAMPGSGPRTDPSAARTVPQGRVALRQIPASSRQTPFRRPSPDIVAIPESELRCGFQGLLNENIMNTYAGMHRRETPRLLSAAFTQGPLAMRVQRSGRQRSSDHSNDSWRG